MREKSHTITSLWRNFGPLFFTVLHQFIEVCRDLFMSSSVKVLHQCLNQVEVWTSDCWGTLILCFFQSFSWRFAALLGIIVLLCDPVWSKLYLWHRWPHVSIEYFDIQFMVHSVTGRCPNHHPSTTVLTAGLRCLGIPIQKLFDLIGFQFFFSFHTNWWIKRP